MPQEIGTGWGWQHKFKIHTVIKMNFVIKITANLYKRRQRSAQLRHQHSVTLCTEGVIQHNELTAHTHKRGRGRAGAVRLNLTVSRNTLANERFNTAAAQLSGGAKPA